MGAFASLRCSTGLFGQPLANPVAPNDATVEQILRRLTLEEKVSLVHGDSTFTVAGVPRVGLPALHLSDGPHGVREETDRKQEHTDDYATNLPMPIGLAATWDPALANAYGRVIGEEARARGKQVMLGPGVNILRTPLNGRNGEYFGEDPYLAGRMAVEYIRGEQACGVASCVKHFVANNQETDRMKVNVTMDERTLREIYLPAFEAAVCEGGALAVMGAYNRFRGEYCSENSYLLQTILKGEWGFRGMVISDWAAVHDTAGAANHGLDLEMGTLGAPDDAFLGRVYREGLRRGVYRLADLDDKVRRNLRVMLATAETASRVPGSLNTAAHQAQARRIAEASLVLLKNDGAALPLALERIHRIAVIGEDAVRQVALGGGSSELKSFYEIAPLAGLIEAVGPRATISYSTGYTRNGPPDLIAQAVAAARAADVAIIVAGLNHDRWTGPNDRHWGFDAESSDRADMDLPYHQDELIAAVVRANPQTVVVLMSGGPVDLHRWIAAVPAVLQIWYPGMEGGRAVAGALLGTVNPSGKLPCTFPQSLTDSPAHALHAYPGEYDEVTYREGLLVGYRWFDARQIEPQFPFGHGLSYAKFRYGAPALVPAGQGAPPKVQFTLSNEGRVAGAEVAQVYVQPQHPRLSRPPQELKGFLKVALQPGETRTVTIALPERAFADFDPAARSWVEEAGDYVVAIASSSRDVRGQASWHVASSRRLP